MTDGTGLTDDDAYRIALAQALVRYGRKAPADLGPFVQEFWECLGTHPLPKLNRWLGYIQGVLIERGLTTVEAERDWTRSLFRPLDFP